VGLAVILERFLNVKCIENKFSAAMEGHVAVMKIHPVTSTTASRVGMTCIENHLATGL
jgi:hypothetical protein